MKGAGNRPSVNVRSLNVIGTGTDPRGSEVSATIGASDGRG